MANDEYLNQLQALLVKLADVQAKIDAAQGGGRPANPREGQPAPTVEELLKGVQQLEPPK